MKAHSGFLCAVLLGVTACRTQADNLIWKNSFDGTAKGLDQAAALVVDAQDNIYVTGAANNGASGLDYVTIKYSPDGRILWTQTYNGPGNGTDRPTAIALDSDGNVYVTGTSYGGSATKMDYATIKYNPYGLQLWVRRYAGSQRGDDGATAIAVNGLGEVVVSGYSWGGTAVGYDYLTLKYSTYGAVRWTQRYDGPGHGSDSPTAIALDEDGNAYVTGYSYGGLRVTMDYMTIKYDPNGRPLWRQRYNGPGNDWDQPTAIGLDSTGNVYVTGVSVGNGTAADFATIKYDAFGHTKWVQRYNGPNNSSDQATAMTVDEDGNVYVAGVSYTGLDGLHYQTADAATVLYDTNGNTLWVNRYTRTADSYTYPTAIVLDSVGDAFVTGYSCDFSGGTANRQCTTFRVNNDGSLEWAHVLAGSNVQDGQCVAIGRDSQGYLYTTGRLAAKLDGYGNPLFDYATLKYCPIVR